jgi:hypothetical protein
VSFLDDVAADPAAIVAEMGETVTYVAYNSGTPVTTNTAKAIVDMLDEHPQDNNDSRVGEKRAILSVLPTLATAPDTRDRWNLRGQDYVTVAIRIREFLIEYEVKALVANT